MAIESERQAGPKGTSKVDPTGGEAPHIGVTKEPTAVIHRREALIAALQRQDPGSSENKSPIERRAMKRCFMTGKQCIFSTQVLESSDEHKKKPSDINLFAAMPFTPMIETAFRWSLKPCLTKGYGLPQESVQRADDVRNIGNIVCEKICFKVQCSDLVIADISKENLNVFYEIGLATGLDRPTVYVRDATEDNILNIDPLYQITLDLPADKADQKVLSYPGVGHMDASDEAFRLESRIIVRAPKTVRRERRIGILDIQRQEGSAKISWTQQAKGAIGVAMEEIFQEAAGPEHFDDEHEASGGRTEHGRRKPEVWQQVLNLMPDKDRAEFRKPTEIIVNKTRTFRNVADDIERSFCTIIDVTADDPIAYFWLGYAHGKGLNVIPVWRKHAVPEGESQEDGQAARRKVHGPQSAAENLAFDIRALWFAEYVEREPWKFKDTVKGILEHLLARDLPDQEKRAFWARFQPESKLKVFTGLIHDGANNREMVGDWDVRAVSELFTYLGSVREAALPELATPLYPPEEAFKRECQKVAEPVDSGVDPGAAGVVDTNPVQHKKPNKDNWIDSYRKGIELQLADCHAVVVASPDVNPISEYLLYELYGVNGHAFEGGKVPTNAYVVVKGGWQEKRDDPDHSDTKAQSVKQEAKEEAGRTEKKAPATKLAKDDEELEPEPVKPDDKTPAVFPRLFFVKAANLEMDQRGFADLNNRRKLYRKDQLLRPYYSQQSTKPFKLLGQLVVATRNNGKNMVVLLNGVSGPATFALAQILTGGGSSTDPGLRQQFSEESERLLEPINRLLDANPAGAIHAIVEVEIEPAGGLDPTFADARQIKSWDFVPGFEPAPLKG